MLKILVHATAIFVGSAAGFCAAIAAASNGSGKHITTGLFLLYFLGQVIHTLAKADAVSVSPQNTKVNTLLDYFRARWRQILAKKFIGLAIFLVVWDNPSVVDLGVIFDNASPRTLAALAMMLGYFSDSVSDKFLSRWEWLKKDAPASA